MKINQSLLIGSTLIATGIYKTIKDYDEAPEDIKRRTLIRKGSIIALSATAIMTTDKFLSTSLNSKKLQSFATKISNLITKHIPKLKINQRSLAVLTDVTADCLKSSLTAISGIAFGMMAGAITDRILSKIPIKESSTDKTKSKVLSHIIFEKPSLYLKKLPNGTDTLINDTAKIFELAGFFPNPLDKPTLLLNSVKFSNEQNFPKTLEKSAIGIVSEIIIPTIFISTTNSLTQKTKNISMPIKILCLAGGFLAGEHLGKLAGKNLKKEVINNK